MKKLQILLLMLLIYSFSPPVYSQTVRIRGENDWIMLWRPDSGVDSTVSRDYFSYNGTQIFPNFGNTRKFNGENFLQVHRFKDFEPGIELPDTLVIKIRILEEEGNLNGKYMSFDYQDSNSIFMISKFFPLNYSWERIKFPIKEYFKNLGWEMEKILTLYLKFTLLSSTPAPAPVGLVVEVDYLSGKYPDGTEVFYDDFGDIVSVPEESLVEDFILYQNYPNPFNPTTTIKFSVPSPAHVALDVYDILGQKVVSLLDEEKVAGRYEVSFNASNLPSGTYFYRFQSGQFVQTKKMTLVK